jgi:hypothetical protein
MVMDFLDFSAKFELRFPSFSSTTNYAKRVGIDPLVTIGNPWGGGDLGDIVGCLACPGATRTPFFEAFT